MVRTVVLCQVVRTAIFVAEVIEWQMDLRDLDAAEVDHEPEEDQAELVHFKVEIITIEAVAFLVKLILGTILRLKIR